MVWVQHLRGWGAGAAGVGVHFLHPWVQHLRGAFPAGVSWYTVDVPLRVLVRSNRAAISHLMAPCTARSDKQVRVPMVLIDGQQ